MAVPTRRPIARKEVAHAIIDSGKELRQVADETECLTPSSLTAIVRGRTRIPKPETRAALARVLGSTEADLFPDLVDQPDEWDEIGQALAASFTTTEQT